MTVLPKWTSAAESRWRGLQVEAEETIETQRILYLQKGWWKNSEEMKTHTIDWSITLRTNCRTKIGGHHLKIQFLKRSKMKDNDCKIKNHSNRDEIFSINKE